MVQTVFNNFEIADMDFWHGEVFFNYLDHNGGFYYQVCPSPFVVNMNRADPTGLSCTNSAGVTRPSTRSGHRYSGARSARTGSTSSGRSDTNIIRSRIAPKATCGSVAVFLRPGAKLRYVAGPCRRSLRWVSLMFLCLDYHGGWPCLPMWEQALNQREERSPVSQ